MRKKRSWSWQRPFRVALLGLTAYIAFHVLDLYGVDPAGRFADDVFVADAAHTDAEHLLLR